MIGNDIIDINETRRSSNWERPGFMQKIFTAKEQSIINASADPFSTVWRLWSMKESAYKIFIQRGGTRFYNPTKIECSLNSTEKGQAEIDQTVFRTNTSIHPYYIFTTASIENSNVDTRIFQLEKIAIKRHSPFIHEQVLTDFSAKNSLNPEELMLHKTVTGVPQLYYQNQLLYTSISITHHGNYAAYSLAYSNVCREQHA